MTNHEVLDVWLEGGVAKSRSLHCGDGMLYSYDKKIGEIVEGERPIVWIRRPEKVSQTVGRHIAYARARAEIMGFEIEED